jgi:hypothetical protein
MEQVLTFKLSLDEDDVLRGQGADPCIVRSRRPVLVKAAAAALQAGKLHLYPVALVNRIKVREHRHERIFLEGGTEISNPLVARHLVGAEEIVVVLCTIGAELETYASSQIKDDPLAALALDGLGNAAVEEISQQVCAQVGEQAQAQGLSTTTPISPGLPEWPVEIGQALIFSLLDPIQVGITLTSGGMMVPKKSISFILGIGCETVQADLCDLCDLRDRCHYRHSQDIS